MSPILARGYSQRSLVLVVALLGGLGVVALAGPPGSDLPPLRPQPEAVEGADEVREQLFYYNGDEKIYLNDTGRAVVKLKGPANANIAAGLRDSILVLDENDPLAPLIPGLEAQNILLVRTRGQKALDLARASEPPEEVEYILPVVEEDRSERDGRITPLTDTATPMLMNGSISVRFSRDFFAEVDDPQARTGKVKEYVAELGLAVAGASRTPHAYTLVLAEGPPTYDRLIQAANALYEHGREGGQILYAKPDFVRVKQPQQIHDPLYETQWHLNNTGQANGLADADIDAPEAWTLTEGVPEVRIAIIDDSVQNDHPDLAGNYQTGRYYNGNTLPPSHEDDPSPRHGRQRHGTACAGVAVGFANNLGVRGSAPRCGLIGVHFWDSSDSQIAEAFYFCDDPDEDPATDDGAAVISCSWSLNIAAPVELITALDDLAENGRGGRGSVILFAAGNDADSIAANQNLARESVIVVGATSDRDERSWYSNSGPELSVVAPSSHTGPAQRIVTTDNTDDQPRPFLTNFSGYAPGDYTSTGSDGFGGTSSATPLTAGVCGLILSVNPELSSTQVRSILEHTADRIRGGGSFLVDFDPTTSHDANYGYGRVNAKKAVHVANASRQDAGSVWPDHVLNLHTERIHGSGVRVAWQNPRDNVQGVMVIRSAQPLQWKPHDGDRFGIGDTVGNGGVVVGITAAGEMTFSPNPSESHYTTFVFNEDHRYSWGQTTRVSPEDLFVGTPDTE